jgi:hypothetical protein
LTDSGYFAILGFSSFERKLVDTEKRYLYPMNDLFGFPVVRRVTTKWEIQMALLTFAVSAVVALMMYFVGNWAAIPALLYIFGVLTYNIHEDMKVLSEEE